MVFGADRTPPQAHQQRVAAQIAGVEGQIAALEAERDALRARLERARAQLPTTLKVAEDLDGQRATGATARRELADRKTAAWAAVARAHEEIRAAAAAAERVEGELGARRASLKDLRWRTSQAGTDAVRLT
jgi:chromosome segregation ATPase